MSRMDSDSRAVTTTPNDHNAEILPPHQTYNNPDQTYNDPVANTAIFRSKKGGLNIFGFVIRLILQFSIFSTRLILQFISFSTRLGLQALENKRADRLREEELERERLTRAHELFLRRMDIYEQETQALENRRAGGLHVEESERERLARAHELSLRRMNVYEMETQALVEQIRVEAEAQADKKKSNQPRNGFLDLMKEKLRASADMNKKAE